MADKTGKTAKKPKLAGMQTVNGVRIKGATVERLGLKADEHDAPTKRRTVASDKARRASTNKARLLTATSQPEESGSDGNPAGES